MRIVFIHGAPAVGKLTVARALLERVPGRLLDNHASIDLALRVADFGSSGFWPLVHTVRDAALRTAAETAVDILVMTACYTHPWDRCLLDEIEEVTACSVGGTTILPVFLSCPDAVAESRVGNRDRAESGKLVSRKMRRRFVALQDFRAVPRPDCLSLSTHRASPEKTARRIDRHFGLRKPQTLPDADATLSR